MRCEVCGREIMGQPLRRVIEGARMTVCAQCARFGSGDWTPSMRRVPPTEQRPRSEVEAAENFELVDDWGSMIRKARQRLGMTVEDLGREIGEKTSVIKKLEKEELMPNETLARKLRNALKIELLVAGEAQPAPRPIRPSIVRTLGDVIKLKQETEETSENEK